MARFLTPSGRSRSLMARSFETPLHSLHQEMIRLFVNFFNSRWSIAPQAGSQRSTPTILNIDVSETDQEVRICADLPGVEDSDIDVPLHGDVLSTHAEKKIARADEKENRHFTERFCGIFQHALRLPCAGDPDKVQATSDNDALTVTLPKSEELGLVR